MRLGTTFTPAGTRLRQGAQAPEAGGMHTARERGRLKDWTPPGGGA